jgi:hypothetical protein
MQFSGDQLAAGKQRNAWSRVCYNASRTRIGTDIPFAISAFCRPVHEVAFMMPGACHIMLP